MTIRMWYVIHLDLENLFIYYTGEPGDEFYIIVEGSASVTQTIDNAEVKVH